MKCIKFNTNFLTVYIFNNEIVGRRTIQSYVEERHVETVQWNNVQCKLKMN